MRNKFSLVMGFWLIVVPILLGYFAYRCNELQTQLNEQIKLTNDFRMSYQACEESKKDLNLMLNVCRHNLYKKKTGIDGYVGFKKIEVSAKIQ
jgi:hypothetical protein